MIKKLQPREQNILIITVVMLVIFAAFQWVIKPMREGGEDIADKLMLAKKKLAKNMGIIKQSSALDGTYERLVAAIGTAASEGAEASAIVAKLDAAAKESKVHIANMQPQRATTKDSLRIFPVELVVEGEWAAVVKFLYLVQAKPNLFNIDELNLEKYSDASSGLRGRLLLSRSKVALN